MAWLVANHDLPRGGLQQSGDGAQKRGFAAAGRPDEGDEFAFFDRQGEFFNGDGFFVVGAVDHAQTLDAHQGFAFGDAGVERIGAVGAQPAAIPFFAFNLDFGLRHPCPSFWKRDGKRIRPRRW